MVSKFRKFLVALLTFVLSMAGIVATEEAGYALDASTFDPGWIISDSVFYDWGTMSADQIQKFLEARVPVCTDNDGGPKCLRNYTEDVVGSEAIKANLHDYAYQMCKPVPAASNQTAAKIIYQVAVACGINPRVLLVTLQKEQGLVGAADPTDYMYKAAMGYGCPDSAPQICGQDSNNTSRLFWQMYRAGWQLKWYGDPRGSFTYLKPGTTISMGYHPNASCGKKSFKLKSQATANLYYYTPYTPNAAALANLWGSGDACSAYGNRNFWRQFWTWFGSPVAGGYLLKSSTSETYLVNQNTSTKYLVTSDAMAADFKPLGPIGTVSETYMNSFTDGGQLKSLVADQSGNRWLIASGSKYPITSSAQATALGMDWVTAPVITDVQISNFPDLTFAKSATTDEVFLLQGTTRSLIADADLVKTLSILGPTAVMQEAALNGFTIGTPINRFVQDTAGLRYELLSGAKIPIESQSIATALGYNWNNATTIATAQLAKLPSVAFIKSNVKDAPTYFISGGAKHLLTATQLASMAKFGTTIAVTPAYLAKFPTGAATTALLKSTSQTFYVIGGKKYVVTGTQAAAMGLDVNRALAATNVQLATLPSPILMKSGVAEQTYLVDDYTNKHPLSAADLPSYSALGATGIVPAVYLDAFVTKTNPGRMVNSADGYHYFLNGSKRYRLPSTTVAKAISPATFASSTEFTALPYLTVGQLSGYALGSTTAITTYTKGTGVSYLIEGGKRREILDDPSLTSYLTTLPTASVLGAGAFTSLPLGVPIVGDKTLFKNGTTAGYGIYISQKYYPVTPALYNDMSASTAWHFTKSTKTLTGLSVAKLTQGASVTNFVTADGKGYLLTAAGKQPITDIAKVTATTTALPSELLGLIETVTTPELATPFVVKLTAASTVGYLINNVTKRPILDSKETTALVGMTSTKTAAVWPKYVVDQLKAGNIALAPASVVKVKETAKLYFIDGWGKALLINSATAATYGVTKAKVVLAIKLKGYTKTAAIGLAGRKIVCGTSTYLVDKKVPLLLDASAIAQWPGTAKTLDAVTCKKLAPTTTAVGLFVTDGTNKYMAVAGKLKLIKTDAEYQTLLGTKTPAVLVSTSLIASIPKV